MTQVVSIDPTNDVAATVTCPHCGHRNEIKWEGNRLAWAPTAEHCTHYHGCYSTGNHTTVEVHF